MKILRSISDLPAAARSGAVSIGNFDGVHLGHARIVHRLVERARQIRGPAVIFTFDPHPVRLLRPEAAPPPLSWTERKAELLVDLGIDWMIAYPTDEQMLSLAPEAFFRMIVREKLDARVLLEGPNFRFGRNRAGDVDLLAELAKADRIELEIVEPYLLDGEIVSSSRVREAIRQGDVQFAARMLTVPYRIRGMVTHGAGRGAKIRFPTANVAAVDTLLPAEGVYAGRGWLEGQSWAAAINIGPNPTFGQQELKVEVHLIDFERAIYGRPLEVEFFARLRDTQPFGSVQELQDQLARDVETARRIASET